MAVAMAHFEAARSTRTFASSEGALCDQRITECGGGIAAVAVAGEDSQIRSYPASHGGQVIQAGYEGFTEPGAGRRAPPRSPTEAAALLRAPACPAGRTTLILAGEQLGVQIHESIGHAVELDRVLGREISYAGGSFVAPDAVGSLRIGSELVNVTADAHHARAASARYRWDDEGVEGQRRADRPRAACSPGSCPRARRPPRSAWSAPAGAPARTASPASRSCG